MESKKRSIEEASFFNKSARYEQDENGLSLFPPEIWFLIFESFEAKEITNLIALLSKTLFDLVKQFMNQKLFGVSEVTTCYKHLYRMYLMNSMFEEDLLFYGAFESDVLSDLIGFLSLKSECGVTVLVEEELIEFYCDEIAYFIPLHDTGLMFYRSCIPYVQFFLNLDNLSVFDMVEIKLRKALISKVVYLADDYVAKTTNKKPCLNNLSRILNNAHNGFLLEPSTIQTLEKILAPFLSKHSYKTITLKSNRKGLLKVYLESGQTFVLSDAKVQGLKLEIAMEEFYAMLKVLKKLNSNAYLDVAINEFDERFDIHCNGWILSLYNMDYQDRV